MRCTGREGRGAYLQCGMVGQEASWGESAVSRIHWDRKSSHSFSIFVENCHKVHFHLPYQWQIFTRDAWNELQPLETIEKMFCDPQKSM